MNYNVSLDRLSEASHCLYRTILYLQQIGYDKEVIDNLISQREKILEDAYQAWDG
jgi:hypothetical protein